MLKEWYSKRSIKQLQASKQQLEKDLTCTRIHLSERNLRMIWNNLDIINIQIRDRMGRLA